MCFSSFPQIFLIKNYLPPNDDDDDDCYFDGLKKII